MAAVASSTRTRQSRPQFHSRYNPLVAVLAAMALGILLDREYPEPIAWWFLLTTSSLVAWTVCMWRHRHRSATVLLLVGVTTSGAAWHHACWRMFPDDEIGRFAREESTPICLEAIALANPRWIPLPSPTPLSSYHGEERNELVVEVSRVRDGNTWRAVSGKARMLIRGDAGDIGAGDRLRVLGEFAAVAQPRNPGEFPLADFERSQRRFTQLFVDGPEYLSVVERGSRWLPSAILERLRVGGTTLLWRFIHRDRAGLASAILLGAREQIDGRRTEGFLVTGTVHLLAISGQNVAIVVYGLWLGLQLGFVRRMPGLIGIAVFAVVYALLTDSQPPVMRAAVLVVMICFARLMGRPSLEFNLLAGAGIVVLALNPSSVFQTGAQLSFLAVAVLAFFTQTLNPPYLPDDPLDRLITLTRPWWQQLFRRFGLALWKAWLATALISALSLPLVWYRFHLISPVILWLNPLVVPPIAVAMFAGFGVFVFGGIVPPLGRWCGWICDQSLACVEWSVDLAQRMPGNHVWMPAPAWWWVVLFYAAIAAVAIFPTLRPPARWGWAISSAWLAVGFFTADTRLQSASAGCEELACTFVAVGHGTCVLVELPDGRNMLYDAGRLGSAYNGARTIASVLWTRGITHLDALVISHADTDHYNAVPELLNRFTVGAAYVSPMMFVNESPPLTELQSALERAEVPVREIIEGDGWRDGELQMGFLHPPEMGVYGGDNANSLVLQIDYAGRRLLLPGDLETGGLERLFSCPPVDCDLVMAPHHGSPHSQPVEFVKWSKPEWVVASTSQSRNVKAVRQSYGKQCRVLTTPEDGAVRVTISRRAFRVQAWRREPW